MRARGTWTRLEPPLTTTVGWSLFLTHAKGLVRASLKQDPSETLEALRSRLVGASMTVKEKDRQPLIASGHVITDLVAQGWRLRVRGSVVAICPPAELADAVSEKSRVRRQELLKRDAQLRRDSVRRFIRSMEKPRLFGGQFKSIFSVVRDGRDLAEALRVAREHQDNGWTEALAHAVDPYLQFVGDERCCSFTGLRLMDVWRHFRHTWAIN